MSYKKLQIWQIAREISIEIHEMTLNELPSFEMFEEGQQIRKSSKSIRSNIVEGYGRRQYQGDYIRFLTYSISSNDETIDHLEMLYECKSLKNKELFETLIEKLNRSGKMLNNFIQRIKNDHYSK
jgi:four helix bundle protein